MPSILIQIDDLTLKSLNKIAPAAKRQREYEQIREAYLKQPDSTADADDWASAEEWKP